MKQAKFYVYRNLRTKNFSVKYKGKVIKRLNAFEMYNVEFKVNLLGRDRVLTTKQKNVHAYAISCSEPFEKNINTENLKALNIITYNPYKNDTFICDDKSIVNAKHVAFVDNRCYKLD